MSIWSAHDVGTKVEAILRDVPTINDYHHFGRPYVTAYQLAIAFERDYEETFTAIGKKVGGRGTGTRDSLAKYLGNELSKQIKANPRSHFAEGAFVSNRDAESMVFRDVHGDRIESSVVGTGFDLALFRLRSAPSSSS